jgi:myo-inositol-1(or 4)-monophosphatase
MLHNSAAVTALVRPLTLTGSELRALAIDCLAIAERGAGVALRGFGLRPSVREKQPNDLLTEHDLASQAVIVALLEERYPGVRIVAEERAADGSAGARTTKGCDLAFSVDPIDGTTNFAHGHPFWCVSIGVSADGRPIAGAVVAPSLALSWHGHVGSPRDAATDRPAADAAAFRNGAPCRVSVTQELSQALLATGFPPQRNQPPHDNFDSFIAVKRRARGVRRCGSAALDLCFVADGTYDGYWERRLHVWDIAGGCALVLAAGGRVSDLAGAEPDLERGHVIASNGAIHDQLAAAIASPVVAG